MTQQQHNGPQHPDNYRDDTANQTGNRKKNRMAKGKMRKRK